MTVYKSTAYTASRRTIIRSIMLDVEADVRSLNDQPFDARTVGTYLGSQAATIVNLARIVEGLLPLDPEVTDEVLELAATIQAILGDEWALEGHLVLWSIFEINALSGEVSWIPPKEQIRSVKVTTPWDPATFVDVALGLVARYHQ